MKNKLLLCSFLLSSVSFAQSLLPVNVSIPLPEKSIGLNDHLNGVKTATCGLDTVQYTTYKATGLAALSINNATSAQRVSQYFDAPQALTLSGVEFYAYKIDATGGITQNVTLQVFTAGADSMPTGTPLATATVAVDTAFGGGDLGVLRKVGNFSPITVSVPYVVVMSNLSPNGVGLIFNSYTAADGAMEWLASADLFGTWTRSYDINVGGIPLDSDALFHPFVVTNLTASFVADDPCFSNGLTEVFTNNSSPIIGNRMYSVAAFIGAEELSYTWNYGDGSPEENLINGTHTYASAGAYDVVLTDSLFGWTSTCVTDTTVTLGEGPQADWSSSVSDLDVSFTDISVSNGTTTYLWDFGDGNTSTVQNSTHTYASAGTYTVCLTIVNACGADSSCSSVTVTAGSSSGIVENTNVMKVVPNPSNASFVVNTSATMKNIRLIGLTGKEVYSTEINTMISTINVSELANGQYLLSVEFEDGSTSNTRIQVQH